MPMEIVLLLLFGLFAYFIVLRPMRKQQAAQSAMRAALEPGSRVMLSSGLYGTVRHLGERQAIVELGPGQEVTVARQAIATVVKPEDEEFEYEDEAPDTSELAGADAETIEDDARVGDAPSAAGPVPETAVPNAPAIGAPGTTRAPDNTSKGM